MFLSVLIIFLIYAMGLTFFVGLILFIIGRLKKGTNTKMSKAGLIIAGIPTSIIVLLFFFNFISEIFSSKPDKKDLVGTYQIVKVTNLDFDKNTYNNYKLEFINNNRFTLTPTPFIEVCENGEYQVDYDFNNELTLKCPASPFYSVDIDRGFGNYNIVFTIGDPDGGQCIYFEKTLE